MTEKLFVNIGNEIHLNGKWWCSVNGEHCADVITPALNELLDETEQLKKEIHQVKDILKEYDDFESFVDSAIAIGFIGRIALAVGMELRE